MLFLFISVLMSNLKSTSYFPMDNNIEGVTVNCFDENSKGGAEGTVESEHNNVSGRPGAEDFGRAIAKIAVAQICENIGFEGFRGSALGALSDLAIQYVRDLGKTANFYTNLAGRTECNLFDVIRGLEDLGTSQGFPTASVVSQCLVSSGMVREIAEYMESTDEIPLAQPVPHFPVIRNSKLIPTFVQMDEMPPNKHIPDWLPAFPDLHTYVHTPMWNERSTDPRADKIEQARQQRKAERSLLSLQQKLVACGTAGTSTSAVPNGGGRELQPAKYNTLSVARVPLDQDVSTVVLPNVTSVGMERENHVSVLQAFAPAIEAVKGGLSDDGDCSRNFLPDKRPPIHFNFKCGKKFVGELLDLPLRNKGERALSSIGRDEERDDRKRRAEFIIRQSMENPHELMQL